VKRAVGKKVGNRRKVRRCIIAFLSLSSENMSRNFNRALEQHINHKTTMEVVKLVQLQHEIANRLIEIDATSIITIETIKTLIQNINWKKQLATRINYSISSTIDHHIIRLCQKY